jgi:hypothetical protein
VKRFIGWVLTVSGGAGALWGGIAVLTGSSRERLAIVPDFSVNAITVGLVGLATLTVGLVWVRD